ncbi:MAG TPA: protein kinase [Gemmatimonadales bacterium]|nr:protein kinase [Gemmatimonadales bacterium]
MPTIPATLGGRYVLTRRIGSGGMATVFLARDEKHDRDVAVKVMHPELARALGPERFLREIGILAQLTHPHILPLHDSGESGGLLYFVMPFIAGESLRDRLSREGQLPLRDALEVACQVAGALDHAHRHGILHRDIKPGNILLEEGHAVVADFGIARAIGASDQGLTATGMSLGTPTYMSPEQSVGEAGLDGRSDIYSLGCVLFEMLAGEPPFTGPTPQAVIAKRLGGPPPRIRTVRPSVPESVERALLRALDPVPADRYATAGEFRTALAVCRDQGQKPAGRQLSRRTLAWVGTAGAAVLLATFWAVRDRPSLALGEATVAVLPLVNASSTPEHAYLAEGLTDALIGDLVATRGIRVISRTSMMRSAAMEGGDMPGGDMPGEDMPGGAMSGPMGGGMSVMGTESPAAGGMGAKKSLREIARELQADILMQGSVRWDADSVSVAATLTRSESLEQFWEGRIARHSRDLFALQRALLSAVTAAIIRDGGGRADPLVAPRAYDPAAHEAYLKGAYFQSHWKLAQASAAFERAVQLDPGHAPAQAGLARAYYFRAFFGEIPPGLALAGMRRAAVAALERDSLLAEAHGQLALVKMLQEWDWDGAEQSFRRALEISPGNAQIRHDYAHFLLGQGRQTESMEQTREAVALDPANPMLISCLGWHSLFDGRYGDAVRHATEANAMMPDHWAHVVLGWALLGQGSGDSALASFREAHRLSGSPFTLAALGHGLAATGHPGEARKALATLLQRVENEYVSPYDIATVYAGLGDADGTFKWLRRAAEERSTFIVHLGWDARFDRVRDDPRFAELLTREMKLPLPRVAAATPDGGGRL